MSKPFSYSLAICIVGWVMDDPSPTEPFASSRLSVNKTGAEFADSGPGADSGPMDPPQVPLHHPADGPPPRAGEDIGPTPTCAESFSELSAEDRLIQSPVEAPRDQAPTSEQLVCRRQTGRQATSAVAYTSDLPEEDDPLLAFTPYLHKRLRRN